MTIFRDRFAGKSDAHQAPQGHNGVHSEVELPLDVSVVLPCLNEEESISGCIEEAATALRVLGLIGEVVVVDNGSTDRSVEIARNAGARVVFEEAKGYGNACRRGLSEARGTYVIMGDADGSYDFTAIPRFIHLLMNGADMVIGNRLHRDMEKGAMPWLHRYVGNPVLTRVLNVLFGAEIQDAHCGLRAIRKECLEQLPLSAPGMEFASEFIIEALDHGVRLEQTRIRYRQRAGGQPKLRTFRDGLRHLRLMFSRYWDSVRASAPHVAHVGQGIQPAFVTGGPHVIDLTLYQAVESMAADEEGPISSAQANA